MGEEEKYGQDCVDSCELSAGVRASRDRRLVLCSIEFPSFSLSSFQGSSCEDWLDDVEDGEEVSDGESSLRRNSSVGLWEMS